METLSIINCPDCDSEKIIQLEWKPYDEQTYKCKNCKRTWDKNTKYCKVCLDVIIFCKCHEEINF